MSKWGASLRAVPQMAVFGQIFLSNTTDLVKKTAIPIVIRCTIQYALCGNHLLCIQCGFIRPSMHFVTHRFQCIVTSEQ